MSLIHCVEEDDGENYGKNDRRNGRFDLSGRWDRV